MTYYTTFSQDFVKLFQEKALGKNDFVIKNLSGSWLLEYLTGGSGPILTSNWPAELNT